MSDRQKAALAFADAFLGASGPPTDQVRGTITDQFSNDELVELGIGLALFHGLSKVLVAVGCEPEQMDITELRTPGS